VRAQIVIVRELRGARRHPFYRRLTAEGVGLRVESVAAIEDVGDATRGKMKKILESWLTAMGGAD
jgi:mRNA-degrading endonuclease toxin of MazEF toxin-antitoxin module